MNDPINMRVQIFAPHRDGDVQDQAEDVEGYRRELEHAGLHDVHLVSTDDHISVEFSLPNNDMALAMFMQAACTIQNGYDKAMAFLHQQDAQNN